MGASSTYPWAGLPGVLLRGPRGPKWDRRWAFRIPCHFSVPRFFRLDDKVAYTQLGRKTVEDTKTCSVTTNL